MEWEENRSMTAPGARSPLFPGLDLTFTRIAGEGRTLSHPSWPRLVEINHCRRGRADWRLGPEVTVRLGPGDWAVHTLDRRGESALSVPDGDYEGLTLYLDPEELERSLPSLLAQSGFQPDRFREQCCRSGGGACRGNVEVERIFAGFYRDLGRHALAYRRVKALELLLYLDAQGPQAQQGAPSQGELIRQVHDGLIRDLSQRVTIEALARQYAMNPTTLKEQFKAVYGASVAAHMKEHRMALAARLLRETGDSVAEIARQVGYESQSRFSAAFKEQYHILPTEYRRLRG